VNHTHKTCLLKCLYLTDHDGNAKVQCGSESYNPYYSYFVSFYIIGRKMQMFQTH